MTVPALYWREQPRCESGRPARSRSHIARSCVARAKVPPAAEPPQATDIACFTHRHWLSLRFSAPLRVADTGSNPACALLLAVALAGSGSRIRSSSHAAAAISTQQSRWWQAIAPRYVGPPQALTVEFGSRPPRDLEARAPEAIKEQPGERQRDESASEIRLSAEYSGHRPGGSRRDRLRNRRRLPRTTPPGP